MQNSVALDERRFTQWTPEFIKFRIRTVHGSMANLARSSGVDPAVIRRALRHPYPRIEALIARAIGVTADEIWPERYTREKLSNARFRRRAQLLQSSTNVTVSGEIDGTSNGGHTVVQDH